MNKSFIYALATASLAVASASAFATDINLTVGGEISPGVYGRVNIGNTQPLLVYPEPVVIVQPARQVVVQPIYLHVPPGHAKDWAKHCKHYNACGRPVYFIKSAEYEPGYQGKGHKHGRHGHGHDKD